MTVVTHLVGGLGNQLFQLAAAYDLSLEQGRSIVVDVTEARLVHDRQGLLPLYQGLSTIDFTYRWLPGTVNSRQARIRQARFISRSPGVAILHTDQLEQFVDDGASPYVHLQGLLMSRDIVERSCGPQAPLRPRLPQPSHWFESMRWRASRIDPVGMHVRRGDFLRDRARGILTGAYYRSALDVLGRSDRPVWVFSDDPREAAEFLGLRPEDGFEFIQLPKGVPAAEALVLLSTLDSIITCNSTFSWWAAFLSNAVVTYPSPFMADTPSPSGHHRSPMNDPSWIQVPAEYV